MSSFQITETTDHYLPAVLKRNKVGWLIEYYALHPQKKKLARNRLKLNRVAKRYTRVSDFKVYANKMVCTINCKLAGGWSPYLREDNTRLYEPLVDVLQLFLKEKERELRPATYRSYKSFVSILTEWVNNNCREIQSVLFNRVIAIKYMDYIYNTRNVSAVTYNNQLKMAKVAFNFAKEKCYIQDNPFEFIKPKRQTRKIRILIPAETRVRIIEYLTINNEAMLLVCMLIYTSLIRPKEIRMVQIKHINLKEKYICIPGDNAKNHNTRYAAINKEIISLLNLVMKIDKFPDDCYLFGNSFTPSSKCISNAKFRKEWSKIRIALNLPTEMQLYSFRDSGINNMLKSGIDPLTVMQHADHHDLSMTTKYANHADPDLINKIYDSAPIF